MAGLRDELRRAEAALLSRAHEVAGLAEEAAALQAKAAEAEARASASGERVRELESLLVAKEREATAALAAAEHRAAAEVADLRAATEAAQESMRAEAAAAMERVEEALAQRQEVQTELGRARAEVRGRDRALVALGQRMAETALAAIGGNDAGPDPVFERMSSLADRALAEARQAAASARAQTRVGPSGPKPEVVLAAKLSEAVQKAKVMQAKWQEADHRALGAENRLSSAREQLEKVQGVFMDVEARMVTLTEALREMLGEADSLQAAVLGMGASAADGQGDAAAAVPGAMEGTVADEQPGAGVPGGLDGWGDAALGTGDGWEGAGALWSEPEAAVPLASVGLPSSSGVPGLQRGAGVFEAALERLVLPARCEAAEALLRQLRDRWQLCRQQVDAVPGHRIQRDDAAAPERLSDQEVSRAEERGCDASGHAEGQGDAVKASRLVELEAEVAELHEELERRMAEAREAEARGAELRARAERAESALQAQEGRETEAREALRAMGAASEQERDVMRAELASAQGLAVAAQAEATALRAEVERLRAELEGACNAMQAAEDGARAASEAASARLRAAVRSLKRGIQEAHRERDEAQGQLAACQAALAEASTELATSREDLSRCQEALGDRERQLEDAREELRVATAALAEARQGLVIDSRSSITVPGSSLAPAMDRAEGAAEGGAPAASVGTPASQAMPLVDMRGTTVYGIASDGSAGGHHAPEPTAAVDPWGVGSPMGGKDGMPAESASDGWDLGTSSVFASPSPLSQARRGAAERPGATESLPFGADWGQDEVPGGAEGWGGVAFKNPVFDDAPAESPGGPREGRPVPTEGLTAAEPTAALAERVRELESELLALCESLAAAQTARDDLERAAEGLRAAAEDAAARAGAAECEGRAWRERAAAAEREGAAAAEDLRAQAAASEAARRDAEAALQELQARLDAVTKQRDNLQRAVRLLRDGADASREALEASQTRTAALEAELAGVTERLSESEGRTAALEAQLAEVALQLERSQADAKEALVTTAAQEGSGLAEAEGVIGEEHTRDAVQLQALEEALASARAEAEALRVDLAAATEAWATSQRREEAAAAALSQAMGKLEGLRAQLVDRAATAAEATAAQDEAQRLREQLDRATADLESERRRAEGAEAHLAEAQRSAEQLRRRLGREEQRRADAERRVADLESALAAARREASALRDGLEQEWARVAALRTEAAAAEGASATHGQAPLAEVDAERHALATTLGELRCAGGGECAPVTAHLSSVCRCSFDTLLGPPRPRRVKIVDAETRLEVHRASTEAAAELEGVAAGLEDALRALASAMAGEGGVRCVGKRSAWRCAT